MANIQINLFEELANIFRQDLEDLGYSTTSLRTPEEVTMMYVTTYERLVSKRVRSIEFANGKLQVKGFGKGYYKYVPATSDEAEKYQFVARLKM